MLEEGISPSALDQHLNAFRQLAKNGMRGSTGEYIDVLELLIDWMGNRTNLSDKDLEEFMTHLKEHGYEPGEPVNEPPTPKRKKAAEVEKEPEEEPEKDVAPEPATKDEPKVAANKEKEPEKKSEPATKDEPKKSASIPSLKQLAGKELGKPPALADRGKPSPEEPKPIEPEKPKASKPLSDTEKAWRDKHKKQKKPEKDLPNLEKEKEPTKSSGELLDLPKLQNIANVKPIAIGIDPQAVVTQDWVPGKIVDVGFTKGFKVLGGDPSRGYILSRKGVKYIFNPSRHPKLGRGLRKIG